MQPCEAGKLCCSASDTEEPAFFCIVHEFAWGGSCGRAAYMLRALSECKREAGVSGVTREQALTCGAFALLQVRELREIVQKHNLENKDGADINGVTAPEAQLLRLGELVETMNSIHSRALRMEGGTAAGLVSASVERWAGPESGTEGGLRPEGCSDAGFLLGVDGRRAGHSARGGLCFLPFRFMGCVMHGAAGL